MPQWVEAIGLFSMAAHRPSLALTSTIHKIKFEHQQNQRSKWKRSCTTACLYLISLNDALQTRNATKTADLRILSRVLQPSWNNTLTFPNRLSCSSHSADIVRRQHNFSNLSKTQHCIVGFFFFSKKYFTSHGQWKIFGEK